MQRHRIQMRELEYSVTQGEPKVDHLVWILHAAALLKAVLFFDFVKFVNISDQKPCTLRAHFTQPYWVLETLPNHYY